MINQVNLTKLVSDSVERIIRSLTTVRCILVYRAAVDVWHDLNSGPTQWDILLPKVPANPT